MDRSHLVIAFLAGVCGALGVALVLQSGGGLPRAQAQAASTGEMSVVTGTGTEQQSRDVLFVVDSRSQRLAVYEYKDKRLDLGAVRNLEYDLMFQEWSARGRKQSPSVKDMRQAANRTKKHHR